MQSFRIFFHCETTGDHVSSETPFETDRDSAVSTALSVLRDDGDFFGVVDDNDVALQFIVEAGGGIRMDLPVPSERGSYFRVIPAAELEAELLRIVLPHSVPPLGDSRFERW